MVAELRRTAGVRVGLLDRVHGLGSIFGKTIRDARGGLVVVAGLLSLLLLLFGAYFADAYATISARRQMLELVANLPPVLQGLAYASDNPLRIDTLGGYISQDVGLFLKLVPGLWSILALSATLAGEAGRGSLEFVAAGPRGRRRIAGEKLAAHVVVMAVIATVVALAAWLTGQAFATLPGDAIGLQAAVGYGLWLGLIGLAAGAVAFALAPWLGRPAAAGLAAAVMFGGYLASAYQATFPAFSGAADLTWYSWTAGHNPLAGADDWRSLALLALVTAVLLTIGVEAFARRDLPLGSRGALRAPGLPPVVLGLRGQVGRTVGELLPPALAWGVGIGGYGLLIAASSRSFAQQLATTSEVTSVLGSLFPHYDVTTTGGVLEASFMTFGYVLAGLAASLLVGRWAADETTGRLELLLATPLTRARWATAGGLGVYLTIAVVTLTVTVGVALGAAAAGGEVAAPAAGTLVLGVYAAGLAGVGLAVGGSVSTRLAGPVVAGLAVVTFLADVLVGALELPGWIRELALSAQMGQPMAGTWEWGGITAGLVIALGGLLVAGWGIRRRDLQR